MYYLDLGTRPATQQNLEELLVELEERKWNRVPVLEDGKARYIVHVSMIDRFVRRKALEGARVEPLTLEDLLGEPAMREMFSKTFTVVSERATLTEAKKAMRATPNCEDVFVTATGDADEAVGAGLLIEISRRP
jgi:CBS domain-containing protein